MKRPIGIEISATRDRVFEILTEPTHQVRWMEGLVEAKYDGSPSRGTRFRHGIKEGAQLATYDGEIQQFQPPIQFGYTVRQPHFTIEVDYLLTAQGPDTLLDYRVFYHPRTPLARVLGRFFSWMPRRAARRHLSRVKELAEKA